MGISRYPINSFSRLTGGNQIYRLIDGSSLIEQIDSSYVQDESKIDDCTFDQSTQTDDFLKGIKELENYVWDSETKTAEIVLNDNWNLTIKRGGCEHFEISASFVYDRILDFEKDREIIFDKII